MGALPPGGLASRRGGGSSAVVVIPTLNEEQSIAGGAQRSARLGRAHHRGRRRQSRCDRRARRGRRRRLIAAGRGYGRACLAAALAAEAASILVFMDGDGADDPKAIGRLIDRSARSI